MIVLGINAYHGDASAAVLVDGEVVAAVEEERFTRIKHQAGFPDQAVRWCLAEVGAEPGDVDHIGISRDPLRHLRQKFEWTMRGRPNPRLLLQRLGTQRKLLSLRDALGKAFHCEPDMIRARLHRVEHHRAHLGSTLFCSPFEDATCVTLDGMGDFVSSMWGHGAGDRIAIAGSVPFPASLGVYYTAFTQYLGLPAYGDEYKLMGLAAYGEPRFLPALQDVLRIGNGPSFDLNLDYFIHHKEGVDMTWAGGPPQLGRLWSSKMEEHFGPPRAVRGEVSQRDQDLAASVQARLEQVELEFLRRVHTRNPTRRLVLAGGVALNCLANGRIRSETPFEEVWIQPAANDADTALGAALWIWHQILGHERSWVMSHAYLGPAYSQSRCEAALAQARLSPTLLQENELYHYVAGRIADGAIVGWFQGRAEFGPRALGARSIVCDPRRADMKDILNARIKHREPFRPFAPSILAEATGEWFDDNYSSPFMLMAYQVRPERRNAIPAVTHEDGTSRLQMVSHDVNPRFHELISAFGKLTGVPVLLNTSFNENEPMVLQPEEAIDCFLRTDMDVLVLGNLVIDRGTSR
ncbi:MAG: carbamoyltransferase family protein [Acidimicrobiales bacterium]